MATQTLITSVSGGYNGGAVISVTLDGETMFTATGDRPYNLNYTADHASFDTYGGTQYVTVIPPATNTSALQIILAGAVETTLNIMPNGANTSYGYTFSDTRTIDGEPPEPVITEGNTLYTPVTYYWVFPESHIVQSAISNDVIIIPYTAPDATYPATGAVVVDGFAQVLFNEWGDAIPGLQMCGITKKCSPTDPDALLFQEYFPQFKYYSRDDNAVIAIENLTTGMFFVNMSSNTYAYTSKAAFEAGESPVDTTLYGLYILLTSHLQANYNLHRGVENLLCYTAVNESTGNITGFRYVEVDGITGTFGGTRTKTFYIIGTDTPSAAHQSDLSVFFRGMQEYEPGGTDDDPYGGQNNPGGPSGPGGYGDGDFDFSSTDIPIPGLPTISATDTGFLTLYNPSAAQLKDLGDYMWSGSFDIQNLKKLFADPMDAILGLHIIPVTGSAPPVVSNTLSIGNVSTGLTMPKCTAQYYELDCGTVNISPKWGAYLDYAPYSKLALFLPYVGFVPISPDDCMGGSIKVVYHVDILSGACCAFVYCYSNRGEDGHTLYTFTGACACDCPVTEGQYTNAVLGILNIASGVAGAIASGLTGNISGAMGGLSSAANTALSMAKPEISRSGSFGGSAGLMGIQYPFLVLTIPRQCTPENQNKYVGYPSFITKSMKQCKGYTEIDVTHLHNMSCTDAESEEIINLLSEGVIF